ncbi:oxidoreductase domain protein [Shewanella halifaxensis HAW-EB4]|uniref:Oxidoreductase domain protein n=1 Tax=Shewanella halifaxensis (strain HAW-EB4) TaxID=458817 RepID=B0TNC8_SHEHH|nr:oxidoreductase domain protein [Shewanella halifaxensis HAW-EB4]
MNFLMLWRILYRLRNAEPLYRDIYDHASWSVVNILSEVSVNNRSNSVNLPDFMRGAWQTDKPLGIIGP